jgi:hypothetical protein
MLTATEGAKEGLSRRLIAAVEAGVVCYIIKRQLSHLFLPNNINKIKKSETEKPICSQHFLFNTKSSRARVHLLTKGVVQDHHHG